MGYFMISRDIFDSAIWLENPHTLKLFIYFIGMARHDRTPKKYPKCTVNRGELVTSLKQISDDNQYMENGIIKQWSRAKVSRLIDSLVKKEYITIISDTYGTHIKVINYDTYQDPNTYKSDAGETVVKHFCNTCETVVSINNKDNKGNNGENGRILCNKDFVRDKFPDLTKIQMTEEEYGKLVELFGESDALYRIQTLHHYVCSKGKKYKSHYHTVLNWHRMEERKRNESDKDQPAKPHTEIPAGIGTTIYT